MKTFKELFENINCFVFDVDGVLTNGQVLVASDGEFLRMMNVKDGYAIQYALRNGYEVAVISGGRSAGVQDRLKRLGVQHIFMGVENKSATLNVLWRTIGITASATLYMGDDIPDIEPMKQCGMAVCPYDAVPEVKAISHYISPVRGGEGCVRDVIEQVMKIHHKW
jgi:3-deoxy-D-manno-octulosonate 8-phosphate phosphatase (KDO 8-P phosphatase)